jgi:hypothetical protein
MIEDSVLEPVAASSETGGQLCASLRSGYPALDRSVRRIKILILHSTDDLNRVRRTSFNHGFCLLKYAPWNSYELHCFGQPVTPRLRREKFDVIMLDTTFLCWRWAVPRIEYLDRLLRDYRFIAESEAIKIALPQDEYDHSAVLDHWLAQWRVDLIYSVCFAHKDILYPQASRYAEIVDGLTGYIDDADIALMKRLARPFEQRRIDVAYRARKLPPHFGRFGQLKSEIGVRFQAALGDTSLALDISVDPGDTLPGESWFRFLGDSRFTLGCESGSSLLDPVGDIRDACNNYLATHPEADFDEIEAACFPGQDMVRTYSATSPRVFEAAVAGVCQVLVPGHYLGVLKANEHYIPLAADASNIKAVHMALLDWPSAKERAAACRAALLDTDRLTYRGFVRDLLYRIEQRRQTQRAPAVTERQGLGEPSPSWAEQMHQLAETAVEVSLLSGSDLYEAMGSRSADGSGYRAGFYLLLKNLAGVGGWPSRPGRKARGTVYRILRRAWHVLPQHLRRAILQWLSH